MTKGSKKVRRGKLNIIRDKNGKAQSRRTSTYSTTIKTDTMK